MASFLMTKGNNVDTCNFALASNVPVLPLETYLKKKKQICCESNYRTLRREGELRVNLIEVYANKIGWQHKIIFPQWNFTELLVDRDASVVQ